MAKPHRWDQMTVEEKQEHAKTLVNSIRGMYIISQALHYALPLMRNEDKPQISNIQDMEILREQIFTIPIF